MTAGSGRSVDPWRRGVTYTTAAVLIGIGLLVLVAPEAVPWLTIPSGDTMSMS
jgi:hypothetical protein